MRIALASVLPLMVAACGQSSSTSTGGSAGTYRVSFDVTVARPTGGTVTSQDGQIRCGTGGTACDGHYAWSAQAVLTATPDPGYGFGTWAGDCQNAGPCVLDTRVDGADKYVVAVFGPAGEVQHGNYTSPAVHGPAFLDRLGGVPGSLNCSAAACHGATYNGAGIAPSCNACHARAGWPVWLTNCTFCHGTRVTSGYDFAADPAKAAPPDAIQQRLTGAPVPARTGAHAQHLTGVTAAGGAWATPFRCETCHVVPADLSHVSGSSARATVALSGAGQASLPSSLGSYDPAAGTCTTYCHGDGKAPGTSPVFASATIACGRCHGVPPPAGHPYQGHDLTVCAGCHPATMRPDGTLDGAGGKHVDGVVQASCDSCHGIAPATGAHAAHFGLTGPGTSAYGDTRTLQEMFPAQTPTTAPAVYAFGCGSCHPLDFGSHANGVVDVVLHENGAPAGTLKSLAAPTAAYDPATGTCSGVYCHSSGQETPAFVATPGWFSGTRLGCASCHANPPDYPSGDAGTATANSHLSLADDGVEFGHFLGMPGPYHGSKHGENGFGPGEDAAAITCQTCHYDTTDPGNTGPSGFYYLDTTGSYALPGGDPQRIAYGWQASIQCGHCHLAGGAATGSGKVLPLRHVNGSRDVVFDPRTTLPPISWLPQGSNAPTGPYWMTGTQPSLPYPAWVSWSPGGTTVSFGLDTSTYDPATKTCGNVACHMAQQNPVWGTPYQYVTNVGATCGTCHPK